MCVCMSSKRSTYASIQTKSYILNNQQTLYHSFSWLWSRIYCERLIFIVFCVCWNTDASDNNRVECANLVISGFWAIIVHLIVIIHFSGQVTAIRLQNETRKSIWLITSNINTFDLSCWSNFGCENIKSVRSLWRKCKEYIWNKPTTTKNTRNTRTSRRLHTSNITMSLKIYIFMYCIYRYMYEGGRGSVCNWHRLTRML